MAFYFKINTFVTSEHIDKNTRMHSEFAVPSICQLANYIMITIQ